MGACQSRDELMISAIEKSNERLMRSALNKGLTVGSQLREGDCTPVTLAARLGNVEALAFLYETAGRKRAAFWRANAAGLGPLHEAAKRPDTEALRWLLAKSPAPNRLDAGDSSGRTPLHYAASLDRAEAVKLLAEAGAHLNARTNHPAQRTPLHASAYLGNAAATAALLDAGAEPHVADNHGDTPAHDAAAKGHTEALKLLMGAGVEMNTVNKEGKTVSALVRSREALALVRSPLLMAVERGDNAAEATEKLCSLGFNPNAGDGLEGRTPLHAAAARNDVAAIRALLSAGALPNIRDRDGNTALHYAAGYAAGEAARLLLDAGGDMRIRNWQGFAPYEVVPIPPPPRDTGDARGVGSRSRSEGA